MYLVKFRIPGDFNWKVQRYDLEWIAKDMVAFFQSKGFHTFLEVV